MFCFLARRPKLAEDPAVRGGGVPCARRGFPWRHVRRVRLGGALMCTRLTLSFPPPPPPSLHTLITFGRSKMTGGASREGAAVPSLADRRQRCVRAKVRDAVRPFHDQSILFSPVNKRTLKCCKVSTTSGAQLLQNTFAEGVKGRRFSQGGARIKEGKEKYRA